MNELNRDNRMVVVLISIKLGAILQSFNAPDFNDCDNCGSEEWDNGVCSLDGLGFCCEECLDAYLNSGRGGILSPNPGDRYNPEPYETTFYNYVDGNYVLRKDI